MSSLADALAPIALAIATLAVVFPFMMLGKRPERLLRARERMVAHALEIALWREEDRNVWRALGLLLAANLRFLVVMAPPLLILALPITVVWNGYADWVVTQRPSLGKEMIVRMAGYPPPTNTSSGLRWAETTIQDKGKRESYGRLEILNGGEQRIQWETRQSIPWNPETSSPPAIIHECDGWFAFLAHPHSGIIRCKVDRRIEFLQPPPTVSLFGWDIDPRIATLLWTLILGFPAGRFFRVGI